MDIPTIAGIRAEMITTERLTTRVLFSGAGDDTAVLFLHGNLSSATWWEETMVALPDGFRGIALDQRGYGAADADAKIDATRGLGDLADDAIALLDQLGIDKAHLVGNSMGGGVVWQLLQDAPERWLTITQVDPGSPYGYGGTKDADGTACYDDFAGSGGGLINPEVVRLIGEQDRSMDSPFCLRSALRQLVYKPPFVPEREEDLLSAALSVHLGEQDYPGDALPSANWPFMAPGIWGVNNALSPKYAGDVMKITAVSPKPPILWIRGSHDLTVSDTGAADVGTLGAAGLIPGWPDADVYPSQPMLAQTRAVLDKYQANGGAYEEIVIDDAAHVPFIDQPEAFNEHFHKHLS